MVKVFEASGRSVPVFNDKHLSTTWARCREMVDDSRRLGFPFLAGSSLPVTWRLPQIDMPLDVPLVESVCVGYGGVDSYDFHGLETAQCMSERRRGGERGIRRVHALKGAAMWKALEADDREATRRADGRRAQPQPQPARRDRLPDGRRHVRVGEEGLAGHDSPTSSTTSAASARRCSWRRSATSTTPGLRGDNGEIVSCQMYLPMPGHGSTTADFFNPLVRHIEDLVLERRANYPVERTLLTSGMVIAGVDSLHRRPGPVETPEMAVAYQAPRESQFRRD